MSLLQNVTTGRQRKPPIIGLSGVAGIGKTQFAASAPKAIFIPTEDGSNELDVARFPKVEKFEDILACIKTLGVEEHEYKTVVLDSLDHAEPLIWDYTCREGGKPTIESFGYGRGYVEALGNWRELMGGLAKLRDRKGMAVIVIAHVDVKRFDDPNSDGYDRYVPRLHKLASSLVVESCDAWGFANWDVKVVKTDKEDRKRGVSQGARLLHWEERPAFIAKNRYKLPSSMPLDWNEFITSFNKE